MKILFYDIMAHFSHINNMAIIDEIAQLYMVHYYVCDFKVILFDLD